MNNYKSVTTTTVQSDQPFTDPLEEEIMSDLAAIHNKFLQLPNQNKFAVADFAHNVHEMQRILSMRTMLRLFPDYFIN